MVKYTDNILKAFATSASLVMVTTASILFFHFPASGSFCVGAGSVVYSMFLYGDTLPPGLLPPGLRPATPPLPSLALLGSSSSSDGKGSDDEEASGGDSDPLMGPAAHRR